jgi:hypothetical protein
MANKQNQQKPLSKSQILENIANSLTLLQAVGGVLTALSLSLGLQLQQARPTQTTPETQATPARTEIHIHQEAGSETTIKFQQIESKLNILNESEDNETLSKAMEAIEELRKLIAEKTAELEYAKVQLLPQENAVLNPEQLQAKVELESNLLKIQDETAKLNQIKQRIEASQEALVWLDPETREEFLIDLAKAAGDAALKAHPELNNLDEIAMDSKNIQKFYWDIEDFLFLIHRCLIVCRPNLLDRALAEKELPTSPLPASGYVTAFTFIRDNKVPDAISSQPAKEELTAYLNHLIKILSSTV